MFGPEPVLIFPFIRYFFRFVPFVYHFQKLQYTNETPKTADRAFHFKSCINLSLAKVCFGTVTVRDDVFFK
jgi:hypothetical protein